jgi:hypothetical protein
LEDFVLTYGETVSVEIQEPTVIERPLAAVWDFCVVHHIENHPRWDPSVELEAPSDDPIRVGSVITRRTTRFGTTTEGTMEITELEPMRIMRVVTQDGPIRINGWMLFEAVDENTTRFTRGGDFPDITEGQSGETPEALKEPRITALVFSSG